MAGRTGDYSVSTKRDPYSEGRERERRGGGGYDGGPGRTGMPTSQDMDRPASPCGTYGRTGTSRGGINSGIRKIQDQNKGGY